MKKLTSLGCLLALVFAGASAFAAQWFTSSVGSTLSSDNWYTTTQGTAPTSAEWTWDSTTSSGAYNNWTTPLTYLASSAQALASKDSTVTTSVKFTAMDIADLAEQTIDSDVKAGLTVVENTNETPSTYSYYGIVVTNTTTKARAWMPLTGATPDLNNFVTVTVELDNNLNGTYTVAYKIGNTALTVASGLSLTMTTGSGATISKVEYLGNFSLASLAGSMWYDPCTIAAPSITGVDSASVSVYDASSLDQYALNAIPRGATVKFLAAATSGYAAAVTDASFTTTGEAATESVTWGDYITASAIPSGSDMPSKITVDAAEIAQRTSTGGGKGGTDYLYTTQDNGQLGWVNYSLGIADNAAITPTNAVQTSTEVVAVNFGLEENPNVSYKVGGTPSATPEIALGETKAENTKVVDVTLVLTDEGGTTHDVKTVSVGMMDTGKDTSGMTAGTKTFDIVAVPWDAMAGGAVTVNNLLNTALLTAGDKLYIWNALVSRYDIYSLTSGKTWEAGTQTYRNSTNGSGAETSQDPAAKTIDKNTAIWIERDAASSIVFAGIVTDKSAQAEVEVAAGGETAATWSLIANPSIKPFAIATIAQAASNDTIVVEDVDSPAEYTYYGKDAGGWKKTVETITTTTVNRRGKQVETQVKTLSTVDASAETIPAGIGFWYVRAAGAAAMTIIFDDNDTTAK